MGKIMKIIPCIEVSCSSNNFLIMFTTNKKMSFENNEIFLNKYGNSYCSHKIFYNFAFHRKVNNGILAR